MAANFRESGLLGSGSEACPKTVADVTAATRNATVRIRRWAVDTRDSLLRYPGPPHHYSNAHGGTAFACNHERRWLAQPELTASGGPPSPRLPRDSLRENSERRLVSRGGIEPPTRRLRVANSASDRRRNRAILMIERAAGRVSRQIAATHTHPPLLPGTSQTSAPCVPPMIPDDCVGRRFAATQDKSVRAAANSPKGSPTTRAEPPGVTLNALRDVQERPKCYGSYWALLAIRAMYHLRLR